MPRAGKNVLVDGPAGPVQTLLDEPETLRGLALVALPHPLLGGANNNKVVYTLAHGLRDFGCLALRPNVRGVGKSAGAHDHGVGETEDLLAVLDYARGRWDASHALPVLLAGYSFGAFVQTRVAKRLAESGGPAEQLIFVAMAAGQVEGNRHYQPGIEALVDVRNSRLRECELRLRLRSTHVNGYFLSDIFRGCVSAKAKWRLKRLSTRTASS